MVHRCTEKIKQPVTVVDLDGTLIQGNTLYLYIWCGMQHLAKTSNIIGLAKITAMLCGRALRVCSHHTMKRTILCELKKHPQILSSFAQKTKGKTNSQVERFIEKERGNGRIVLLATAAPSFYVRAITHLPYVASEINTQGQLLECRGNEKLTLVTNWLSSHNGELHNVVTDHIDDAPLFFANKTGSNILVNPSNRTLRFFRKFKPTEFFLIEEL